MRTDAELAEILKNIRINAGLSQDELASRLYVDQAIVSKIENGKIQPAYSIVKQWAKVTNSTGLLAAHMAGENWRKQQRMESALKEMRTLLGSVNFMRRRKV